MPVTTNYVDQGRGAYKHAHGVLTSTDILVTGLLQAQDTENTVKLKYILYDCADVTDVHIGHDVVVQLVELNRKTAALSGGGLVACIAPNPLLFGLARTWQSMTGDLGWNSRIFQARLEAATWLREQLAAQNFPSPFLDQFLSTHKVES